MKFQALGVVLALAAVSCDSATETYDVAAPQMSANGVIGSATGGGHYSLGGTDVQFAFSAVQKGDGTAHGQFHIALEDGFSYDVRGEVTCVATDPITGRAWIGGVITENNSTDPAFQTPIHQPGRDVWFRVLDAGEGKGAVDRTSFYGFEGGAGIITSAQYCEVRLWAPDNARTWPVTEGNIQVR